MQIKTIVRKYFIFIYLAKLRNLIVSSIGGLQINTISCKITDGNIELTKPCVEALLCILMKLDISYTL